MRAFEVSLPRVAPACFSVSRVKIKCDGYLPSLLAVSEFWTPKLYANFHPTYCEWRALRVCRLPALHTRLTVLPPTPDGMAVASFLPR